ncbi:hypothetical protein NC653_003446 [Populus alba x Populus x berolinensis]|uniref:Uncharacterized protein n=1 Tax=Populus alba x Populus x berolinensis TaxID=444605 RepID=A0AAD6RTC6_9ROSI|nr:hypothetical protein NC653_003446 [Populus alba x Populus x berolinensis]
MIFLEFNSTEAHRSTIFTTTKNRERNRERKNRKEMDAIDSVFDPLREFSKDSVRLVKRCHKPDRKEFTKVAFRTAIGFVVMGFVGFFVKLIFIPINNIIVGSDRMDGSRLDRKMQR